MEKPCCSQISNFPSWNPTSGEALLDFFLFMSFDIPTSERTQNATYVTNYPRVSVDGKLSPVCCFCIPATGCLCSVCILLIGFRKNNLLRLGLNCMFFSVYLSRRLRVVLSSSSDIHLNCHPQQKLILDFHIFA